MIISDLIARLPALLQDAASSRNALHDHALALAADAGLQGPDCQRAANCLSTAYDLVPQLKPLFFWPDNRYAFCVFPDHDADVRLASTLHHNPSAPQPADSLFLAIHEIETTGVPRNDDGPDTAALAPLSFKLVTASRWLRPAPETITLQTPVSALFASPPPTHDILDDERAYDFLSAFESEATNWEPDTFWEDFTSPLPPS